MMKENSKFYICLEKAASQLNSRSHFKTVVEAWWKDQGWGFPPFFPENEQSAGVLCRQLGTGRFEDMVFEHLAKKAGLMPVWAEYLGDKFSEHSDFKCSLIHPFICDGLGKGGGFRTSKRRLLDMKDCLGKRLGEIKTERGFSLVDYHHEQQDRVIEGAVRFDVTQWFHDCGATRAKDYYVASMSLFIAHGVLFEDYHGGESGHKLSRFTKDVFEPAWHEVERIFGATPLIVQLPWRTEFSYYPDNAGLFRKCITL